MEFTINAIYPSRLHLSLKVRTFIDLLATRFAGHTGWSEPTAAPRAVEADDRLIA